MTYLLNFTEVSYGQDTASGTTKPALYFDDYHPFTHVRQEGEAKDDVFDSGCDQGLQSSIFDLEPEYPHLDIPDGEIGLFLYNLSVLTASKDHSITIQSESPKPTPPTSPKTHPRPSKRNKKKPYTRPNCASPTTAICECLLADGTVCGVELSSAHRGTSRHFQVYHSVSVQLDERGRPFVRCMWPGCTKTQANMASLVQHLRAKHLKLTESEPCKCCGRAFSTESELRRHQGTLKYQNYIASSGTSSQTSS
uniref:C2H2-type domain-containing protein n=1 Tax=Moniliophthora roreri TaxID=221103 RepID=A0A0W0F496_MONRR